MVILCENDASDRAEMQRGTTSAYVASCPLKGFGGPSFLGGKKAGQRDGIAGVDKRVLTAASWQSARKMPLLSRSK